MKVDELLGLLEEFEQWHADYKLAAEVHVLRSLGVLLKDHEKSTVASLVAAIRASRPAKAA